MKITRTSNGAVTASTKSKRKVNASAKAEAVEYIRSAISVLGDSAIKGDTESKDAIANLSVILFDLK